MGKTTKQKKKYNKCTSIKLNEKCLVRHPFFCSIKAFLELTVPEIGINTNNKRKKRYSEQKANVANLTNANDKLQRPSFIIISKLINSVSKYRYI